ncbi:sodium:proton antiporter [Anabaena sp. UHCC 0204]|nr:sodium:proton antiporter [Anabaena sp. UHCC 0204]
MITLAILLLVILVVPILFDRLKLPALVGLVGAGVVLGPSGWNLLPSSLPMINLVSDIGLAYLMFIAGLEVDFQLFRNQKIPALIFGGITVSLSLLLGILLGEIFNWTENTSILIGALLAAYSPLAYPIISRLGIVNNPSVNVTMAATLITNISALLILSISIVIPNAQFIDLTQLMIILPRIIIYMTVIVVGIDWVGKEFFRRFGDNESYKFLFVLCSVFFAAVVAQWMGIEKIVGVFLAGLAVNDAVEDGPVKEKLLFIGSVLFIPVFFVHLGLVLNLSEFIDSNSTIKLLIFMLLGLIICKFITAFFIKILYQYNWQETLTMWSLSMPVVGTTLAVTLVGYRSGLLSSAVFNNIIILTLITSLFSPWLTSRFAGKLTCAVVNQSEKINLSRNEQHPEQQDFNILVPVYNPQTQQNLIEMAALLARQAEGKIVPLAIAHATAQMHNYRLEKACDRSERLLAKATTQCQSLGATVAPLLRIDDAFAPAISRAAREQKASLIIMGWGKRHGLRARLFGNVIDNVLWSSHCSVVVARLVESPSRIQRILVPIENLTTPSFEAVKFAQILANANQAQVTLLNVCISEIGRLKTDKQTTENQLPTRNSSSNSSQIEARHEHLHQWLSQLNLPNPPEIQIIIHENVGQAILQAARLYDLVVFPYIRNHTSPGGLANHDVTTQLARQLTCSIIILKESGGRGAGPAPNQDSLGR